MTRPQFFCPATQALSSTLPPPARALREPNGLLAIGGSLDADTLLAAYRLGIFPWYSPGQPLLWWSPDPRAVIRPENFHASRSLQRTLRRDAWRITVDRAFTAVIHACAAPRRADSGTWLTPEMIDAYLDLYRLGHAHSLECWRDGRLAGGVYGVAVGRVFCGESMFSRVTDGSKIALYALCRRLRRWGYRLLDCQIENPHLTTLGAELIPRAVFCEMLRTTDNETVVADAAWRDEPEGGDPA